MPNKHAAIVSKQELVLELQHRISVSQVMSVANTIAHEYSFGSFPFDIVGEEKPQPFIPLDLDRQVDGKIVSNHHISTSPPNGRLPTSSNSLPNSILPMPSHLIQPHSLATNTSPTISLDGGVYQGQSPVQVNEWNPNAKVSQVRLFVIILTFHLNTDDDWFTVFHNVLSYCAFRLLSRLESSANAISSKFHVANALQRNDRSTHR
jgi:hypothetical protein